ncbi:MAG: sigma-70 family RNA polymerase sigma factor [Pseudomonadota bacterium]
MEERTDESLMIAVSRGDEQAFAELMQRHLNALHHYASRLTRSPSGADDLIQETWLAVWRRAGTFKPRKVRLSTWLHRILHNRYVDSVRRNRLVLDEAVVAAAPDIHDLGEAAEAAQRKALLDNAIAELPVQQKAAILLTHQQGLTNQEVAVVMGLSVRAVESQLARARRTLKDRLRESR